MARPTGALGTALGGPSAVVEVSIRGATLADAARLAELSEVLGYPSTVVALVERLGRLLGRDEELILVAEVSAGCIVGWLHGGERELLESGRRGEILGLVVDRTHRGQGVGRRLVQAAEAWASTRGLDQMAVRSNVGRAESHPFYERLGYVRAKTQHAYRKRLICATGASRRAAGTCSPDPSAGPCSAPGGRPPSGPATEAGR